MPAQKRTSSLSREKKIMLVSAGGIVVNLICAGIKWFLGTLSGSVSLRSDALNNLSDSGSSLLTIAGTWLAGRKPDDAHPFGYGRIEYMTSLVVAALVFYSGIESAISSIQSIFHPVHPDYTWLRIAIIALTIALKIGNGLLSRQKGKQLHSGALEASGSDALSDAALTGVMLLGAVISMYTPLILDGWMGLVISLFIMKAGLEIVREALDNLLGESADYTFGTEIIHTIEQTPEILSAHDLIIHNYGPKKNLGTVNVELESSMEIGQAYPILRRLQNEIMARYHIYLVFGFYAINSKDPQARKLVLALQSFMKQEPDVLGYHAPFVDPKDRQVFADLVIDFKADGPALVNKLKDKLRELFPGYEMYIAIDRNFAGSPRS